MESCRRTAADKSNAGAFIDFLGEISAKDSRQPSELATTARSGRKRFGDAIKDCTRRGALVLDHFCGSGTILIAAERTGGKARALEIDPHYVDVAVRRWQTYTGKQAVLAATGRTTRSVSVTDARLPLLERLRPAIDQIAGALEDLNQDRQRPLGRPRIYAVQVAGRQSSAPVWGRSLSTYPEVHLNSR